MSKDRIVFIVEELLEKGSQFHYLESTHFSIGRSSEVNLKFDEQGISRIHLKVWSEDNKVLIADQGSKNGTKLNDQLLESHKPYLVSTGDFIQLGHHKVIQISLESQEILNKNEMEINPDVPPQFIENYNELDSEIEKEPLEAKIWFHKKKQELDELVKKVETEARDEARKMLVRAEVDSNEMIENAQNILSKKNQEIELSEKKLEKIQWELNEFEGQWKEGQTKKNEIENRLMQLEKEKNDLEEMIQKERENFSQEEKNLIRVTKELENEREKIDEELREFYLLLEQSKRSYEKNRENEKISLQAQKNAEIWSSEFDRRRKEKEDQCRILNSDIEKFKNDLNNIQEQQKKINEEIIKNKKESEESLNLMRMAAVEDIENYKVEIENEAILLLVDAEKEVMETLEIQQKKWIEREEDLEKAENESRYRLKTEEEKTQKKINEWIGESERQAQLIIKNAEKWAEDNLLNSRRKAEEELERIRIEKRTWVEKAEEDLLRIQRESRALVEQSQAEADQIKSESKEKSQSTLEEMQMKVDKLLHDTQKKISLDSQQALEKSQALIAEAQREAQEIKLKTKQMMDQEKKRIETEQLELQAQIKEEQERFASEINNEKNRLMQAARTEHDQKKKQDSLELSAFKMKQIDEVNQRVRQLDKEARMRRMEESAGMALQIHRLLLQKLSHYTTKDLISKIKDPLSDEIQDLVKRTLNEENVTSEEDLKRLKLFDGEPNWKVRRFWRRMGYGLSSLVVLYMGFYLSSVLFPGWQKRFGDKVLSNKSSETRFLEEIKKKREHPKFSPPQTDDFKNNYVENVIYTKNFIDLKMNKQYQDKWISNLNVYFLDNLKLNENAIVNFVARENSLLKDLQNMRVTLQPVTAEEGIRRMNELEARAIDDFKKILGGNLKFKKYKEFEREYFEKNKDLRQLASSPEPLTQPSESDQSQKEAH